jgi:hypothetical protein
MHDDSKRNVHLSENPTSPALISPPLLVRLLLLLLFLLFPAAYSARVVDSLPKTLIPSSHQVALQKKKLQKQKPIEKQNPDKKQPTAASNNLCEAKKLLKNTKHSSRSAKPNLGFSYNIFT